MIEASELDVFGCPLDGIRLIEASAGTGKTWNLCGLFLRLLLERGLEVQQVLVVTFTNAATAELRERIRARVAETLAHLRGNAAAGGDPFVPQLLAHLRAQGFDDAAMNDRLELALTTFDEASIFTIHGFCQRALADAPFSAGMPMQVELLEDDAELRAEVVNDFWRRHVASDALDPQLAAHLALKGDSPQRFDALLKRRLAKPLASCLWPADIDAPLAVDTGALQQAFEQARTLWHGAREAIVQTLLTGLSQLNGTTYKADAVQQGAADWDRWLAGDDGPALLAQQASKAQQLLGRTRLVERTKRQCRTPEHTFFDAAQALLDAVAGSQRTLALLRLRLLRTLLDDGSRTLREAKRQRRVIAFDDMLFNLHAQLTGPRGAALAERLRQRFPAALIDEFQDTDPLQFGTFQRLYGDGDAPLFLLGDPKQAIYSFRNADLQTYLQAREQARARYTLLGNQRSSAALLAALNALFGANPAAFMQPGLDYPAAQFGAKPRPAFDDRSAPCAALQLWRLPHRDADGQPLLQAAARRAAVDATAAEIARLLRAARRGEVQHGGRALTAGHIAVLVRSHLHGSLVRQALAALGVGSVELSQASVFASTEAEDLERLLLALTEPGRVRLLNAALATETMGVDAAGIDALAADEPALLAVMQRFAGYQQTWQQRGVAVMLRRWMAGEQVAERLLGRSDGQRRLTNLLHLAEALHQASREHAAPEALLHWLQLQRQDGRGDEAAQLRLESDQDLVQIVTVHKSKGLEYPVVFCPLLWESGAPPRSSGDGVELHDDEGRSVIDSRAELDEAYDAAAVKKRRQLEADAETMRLIYVALTRAVQRCVLVVGCPARLSFGHVSRTAGARNLLNWLVAGAGTAPAAWHTATPDVAAIEQAWVDLAQRQAPQIGLVMLPSEPGTPLPPEHGDAADLAARDAPVVPAAWRIGSYSSLVFGAQHEQAALDHDARVPVPLRAEAPGDRGAEDETGFDGDSAPDTDTDTDTPELAADDILAFPRGPAAGDCLHTLFERADFSDPAGWPAAATAALRHHRAALPQGSAATGTGADAGDPHARRLQRLLHDVLNTPLPLGTGTPLRLATLPPSRRLVELEFHLPAAHLDAAALNHCLHAAGLVVPRLNFGTLQGYLKGFIDLVFEHDGRWFVLDWKSNHLGVRAPDYGAESMAAAMAEHGYTLQALLYGVALDRLLRCRLPGYEPAAHLGGAVYLFVRGVRPDWHDAEGRPRGMHLEPLPPPLIEQLSHLLASAGVPA